MKPYFVKTPAVIQQVFKNYYWRFDAEEKKIFLTFDDGPTPEITTWVLKTLAQYDAKATFFCIGKNITQYPTLFKKTLQAGHSIGNHTYNHLNGWKTNSKKYINSVFKTEEICRRYGSTKHLFRPPYGKIKPKQANLLRKKGYQIIMWDVLSADFDATISEELCLENTLKNTTSGSVVVFHDSLKCSEKIKYVLPKFLKYFSEKGYKFNAITTDTVAPSQ